MTPLQLHADRGYAATVFVSSALLLVLEIVAGRLIGALCRRLAVHLDLDHRRHPGRPVAGQLARRRLGGPRRQRARVGLVLAAGGSTAC
jgi:hypothetical protein